MYEKVKILFFFNVKIVQFLGMRIIVLKINRSYLLEKNFHQIPSIIIINTRIIRIIAMITEKIIIKIVKVIIIKIIII